MDVSAGFDIPNSYGLQATDFGYDMTAYRSALGFLSDLIGGSSEEQALTANGGNPMLLKSWESNGKFRRVLAKVRAVAERDRLAREAREAEAAEAEPAPTGQQFVPLMDMPIQRRSMFNYRPGASWGEP